MYTVEGLRHGISQAKQHIKVLEEAIEKERRTIADYKIMIDSIEAADRKKKAAEKGVRIEVVK